MGCYPLHGPGIEGFPGPGGAVINRAAPAAADRQEVVVNLDGGGKGRGGI